MVGFTSSRQTLSSRADADRLFLFVNVVGTRDGSEYRTGENVRLVIYI